MFVLVPVQTVAPAPAGADVDRAHTLILDNDNGRNLTPDIWNPFLPGTQFAQGYHQAILEPLFMLNYETGQIVPWVGQLVRARTNSPASVRPSSPICATITGGVPRPASSTCLSRRS